MSGRLLLAGPGTAAGWPWGASWCGLSTPTLPACINSLSGPRWVLESPCPLSATAGSREWVVGGGSEGPQGLRLPGCLSLCRVAWSCLAGLGHLGWGWGIWLLSPETLVGSCSHPANQLAREVRGRFPAGDPMCSPGLCGQRHACVPGGEVSGHFGLGWLREEGCSESCRDWMGRRHSTSDLLGSFAPELLALCFLSAA